MLKFIALLMILGGIVILLLVAFDVGMVVPKNATRNQLITAWLVHGPSIALAMALLFNAGVVALFANVALAIKDIAQNTAHLKP